MIMKKHTYIQPKMNVEVFHMEAIMIPQSPTDGSSDPHAPARMMNIPAVQANDSVKVF